MKNPLYLTTAIHYPNGPPHIGHAYEMVMSDIIVRANRMNGRETRLQTGTDEHGLKMSQTAQKQGIEPQELADRMSELFYTLADKWSINYDNFQRTSTPEHYAASQAIWKAMEEKGDLYLGKYEGWYSVRDEAFYDESELVTATDANGKEVRLSPEHSPVEWMVEESWFFRLSHYQDKLLEHYRNCPHFIRPESRRNEMIRFVEGGLQDLSISRTSFEWGVPVPGSAGHVMYVWVDALTNYLTGLGYPEVTGHMKKYWPENNKESEIIHIIGKDIVRFHTVYWPAFLMSAGIRLPDQVFGHGFILNKGEKMSKSVGNVVDPLALVETFGADILRYFLAADVVFGKDGSYSAAAITEKANADLSNSFGNLVQRTCTMIVKNFNGVLKPAAHITAQDEEFLHKVEEKCHYLFAKIESDLAISMAMDEWLRGVHLCNQYIDEMKPWALKKTDPARMHDVLMNVLHAIRALAIALQPVCPSKMERLFAYLGNGEEKGGWPESDKAGLSPVSASQIGDRMWLKRREEKGFILNKPAPLFPRIEWEEER